jgi:hypothetical protein
MKSLRMFISLIFVCLISFPASAVVVIPGNVDVTGNLVSLSTGKHEQTLTGQVFTFLFEGLPESDGIDGELLVQARGDYSIGHVADENLRVSIDSFNTGQYGATQSNLIQPSFNFEDNEWSASSAVPGALLSFVTADGEISLVVTLNREVEIGLAAHQTTADYVFDPYVDVTLSYTVVPIPMGIALFATALFSLVTVRRKSL